MTHFYLIKVPMGHENPFSFQAEFFGGRKGGAPVAVAAYRDNHTLREFQFHIHNFRFPIPQMKDNFRLWLLQDGLPQGISIPMGIGYH